MKLRLKVDVIDDISNPGSVRHQDMVALGIYDAVASKWTPTASTKNVPAQMELSWTITTPDLFIKESMEVQTGIWDDDSQRYVGGIYIGTIGEQNGDVEGGEHTLSCEVDAIDTQLVRITVDGWPEQPRPNGIHGVPYDYSVADYLRGPIVLSDGTVVGGLLPTFMKGVQLGGIDEIFEQVKITVESPIGINNDENNYGVTGDTNNYFAYTDLKECLDALVSVVYTVSGGTIIPSYFFTAIPAGDELAPKFHFIDSTASSPSPVAILATDANINAGEIHIAKPFKHHRDFRSVVQDVLVKGVFADSAATPVGGDLINDSPLVAWREWRSEHASEYSTPRYIKSGRWGAKPQFVQEIATVAHARRMAERIEQQTWGARGNLTMVVEIEDVWEAMGDFINPFTLFAVGNWVQFRDTVEGIGVNHPQYYMVNENEIDLSGNSAFFTLNLGVPAVDIADVIKGGTMEFPLLLGDSLRGASHRRYNEMLNQAWPQQAPASPTPVHSKQNVTQPRYAGITAHTYMQQDRIRPDEDVSGLKPEALTQPYIQTLGLNLDGTRTKRAWINQDQTGHPIHLNIMFSASGSGGLNMPDPGRISRMSIVPLGASATVSLKLNNIAVSVPFDFKRDDDLEVTISGYSSPKSYLTVLLSESEELPPE